MDDLQASDLSVPCTNHGLSSNVSKATFSYFAQINKVRRGARKNKHPSVPKSGCAFKNYHLKTQIFQRLITRNRLFHFIFNILQSVVDDFPLVYLFLPLNI